MFADFLPTIVLFGLLGLGLVLGGFIDARVSTHHPSIKGHLGDLVYVGPSPAKSLRHGGRWLRFLFWDHYAVRDKLLTALCLIQSLLWLLVITLLLGIWSLPVVETAV